VANKTQELQKLIRWYKQETGIKDVNMHAVAEFAMEHGWKMPKPKSEVDLLAQDLSKAAREEIRVDRKTGKPYRANHAYTAPNGQGQLTLWIDIDEAPRFVMHKSLINRRNQMVGDALQLRLDQLHWNAINPNDEPIEIPLDFEDDVEWRLNTPDDLAA
jgi:hypothetical protein